ncbi:SPOR domain-containing protein [Marinomonas agarivorans]|nr:SPOR domain-containing protein [Marinomonas agarivorans]
MPAKKKAAPKKGATRRKAPTTKKQTKWWMWLIIPAIVAVFIYALLQLPSTSSPTIEKVTPSTEKKPSTVTKKTDSNNNQKSETEKKDGFEFYQILQDSEVDTSHVDAYKSTPRAEQDFYYMIQAASFRNPADADRMRADLILSGMDASIRKTTGKNGQPWHRVIVGPFTSRSKMNQSIDKLAGKDIQAFSYRVKKK